MTATRRTRRTRRTEDTQTPVPVPVRVGTLVVLAALGAITTACDSSSPASALAGTWTGHCSIGAEHTEDLTTRFADNGQFSSSSAGPSGHESSGTFALTAPSTLTISTPSGTLVYGYKLINNVLTLTNTTARGTQTCNLPKQ